MARKQRRQQRLEGTYLHLLAMVNDGWALTERDRPDRDRADYHGVQERVEGVLSELDAFGAKQVRELFERWRGLWALFVIDVQNARVRTGWGSTDKWDVELLERHRAEARQIAKLLIAQGGRRATRGTPLRLFVGERALRLRGPSARYRRGLVPRQPAYDAATNEAADAIRSLVLQFFRRHEHAHAQEPVAGSSALRDAREALELPGARTLDGNPIREMWQIAGIAVFAAEDHTLALADLLESEQSILAHGVVARSILESAGRTWWLLDPKLTVAERVARSLGYQYEGHCELAERLLQPLLNEAPDHPSTPEVVATLRSEEEELLAVADTLGVLTTGKNGKPWAGRRPPRSTKLAADVQEGAGHEHGRAFYSYLSGVAHGDLRRLAMYLRPAEHPEGAEAGEGSSWSQPTRELEEVLNVTRRAVDVLVFAQRVYWRYMGWEEVWAIDGMAQSTMSRLQPPTGPRS